MSRFGNYNKEIKWRKALNMQNVMHRLLRVVLTPLIVVTMCIVTLSAIISIPIWVVSGKTIIPYAIKLANLHIDYAWG